jgi:hypothetical protein
MNDTDLKDQKLQPLFIGKKELNGVVPHILHTILIVTLHNPNNTQSQELDI